MQSATGCDLINTIYAGVVKGWMPLEHARLCCVVWTVLHAKTCGEQGCWALSRFQEERGTSYLSIVMLLLGLFRRLFDLLFQAHRHLEKTLTSCTFVSSQEPKPRNFLR
jgi:hypothetical protein